jgi:hypothetical protein
MNLFVMQHAFAIFTTPPEEDENGEPVANRGAAAIGM